eukprot:gene16449-22668_t
MRAASSHETFKNAGAGASSQVKPPDSLSVAAATQRVRDVSPIIRDVSNSRKRKLINPYLQPSSTLIFPLGSLASRSGPQPSTTSNETNTISQAPASSATRDINLKRLEALMKGMGSPAPKPTMPQTYSPRSSIGGASPTSSKLPSGKLVRPGGKLAGRANESDTRVFDMFSCNTEQLDTDSDAQGWIQFSGVKRVEVKHSKSRQPSSLPYASSPVVTSRSRSASQLHGIGALARLKRQQLVADIPSTDLETFLISSVAPSVADIPSKDLKASPITSVSPAAIAAATVAVQGSPASLQPQSSTVDSSVHVSEASVEKASAVQGDVHEVVESAHLSAHASASEVQSSTAAMPAVTSPDPTSSVESVAGEAGMNLAGSQAESAAEEISAPSAVDQASEVRSEATPSQNMMEAIARFRKALIAKPIQAPKPSQQTLLRQQMAEMEANNERARQQERINKQAKLASPAPAPAVAAELNLDELFDSLSAGMPEASTASSSAPDVWLDGAGPAETWQVPEAKPIDNDIGGPERRRVVDWVGEIQAKAALAAQEAALKPRAPAQKVAATASAEGPGFREVQALPVSVGERRGPPKEVFIRDGVTVRELAKLLQVTTSQLEAFLFDQLSKKSRSVEDTVTTSQLEAFLFYQLGEKSRSVEDTVFPESAELAAIEFGHVGIRVESDELERLPRPAVITIMGHVDHGKTSLLDAMRKTNVVDSEHIGAFEVLLPGGERHLTFLDTPGHAAFSSMRARGAAVTDIVVLAVSADDSVMPQTREALSHARAAGCPVVVALTKTREALAHARTAGCPVVVALTKTREALAHARAAGCPVVVALTKVDLPTADPERVKMALMAEGLELEEFGGSTQCVETSVVTMGGLADLQEAITLEAEMMELDAPVTGPASATVVEAKLDRRTGALATVVVKRGTLRVGDSVVVGTEWGPRPPITPFPLRRSQSPLAPSCAYGPYHPNPPGPPLIRPDGRLLPVPTFSAGSIRALSAPPRKGKVRALRTSSNDVITEAGPGVKDRLRHLQNEMARLKEAGPTVVPQPVKGEDNIEGGQADPAADSGEGATTRSCAPVEHAMSGAILYSGVGPLTASDINLAAASGASLVMFNQQGCASKEAEALLKMSKVPIQGCASKEAKSHLKMSKVPIVTHNIIYHLVYLLMGLVQDSTPMVQVEEVVGSATVLAMFPLSASNKGKMSGGQIAGGPCTSIRRHKQEVDSVAANIECGVVLAGGEFSDFKLGDLIECVKITSAKAGGGAQEAREVSA